MHAATDGGGANAISGVRGGVSSVVMGTLFPGSANREVAANMLFDVTFFSHGED